MVSVPNGVTFDSEYSPDGPLLARSRRSGSGDSRQEFHYYRGAIASAETFEMRPEGRKTIARFTSHLKNGRPAEEDVDLNGDGVADVVIEYKYDAKGRMVSRKNRFTSDNQSWEDLSWEFTYCD